MPSIMTLQGPALNCLSQPGMIPPPWCPYARRGFSDGLAGITDTIKANPFALLAIGAVVGAVVFRGIARTSKHAEIWGVQRYDQARARSLSGSRRRKRR